MKLLLLIALAVFVLGFSSTQNVFAETNTISDKTSCENSIINSTWIEPNTCKVTNDYTINSGDELIIAYEINLDFPLITTSKSFTNWGTLTNYGLINFSTCGMINEGSAHCNFNHGTINNYSSGTINLGSLNNNGTINTFQYSDIIINSGAIINNHSGGTIHNGGDLHNYGNITNSGTLRILLDGTIAFVTFHNHHGGTITNESDGTIILESSGMMNNYGIINNSGIINLPNGWIYNYGIINNYYESIIDNQTYIINYPSGIINNSGTINNTSSGLNNQGILKNCGGNITGIIIGNPPTHNCSITISDKTSCENISLNFTWVEPKTCKVTNDYTLLFGYGILIDNNIDLVFTESTTLTNSGTITNYGNITDTYDSNGTTGILNSIQGGIINNMKGGIFNSKDFVNSYSFNNFGILNNTNTINNWGNINNNPGGTIYSSYMINMANITINSNSTFNNNIGHWNNWGDSLLINNGTITINSDGILNNNPGRILNKGTIDNNGDTINSGIVANIGIFNNNNILQNAGNFSNNNIIDPGTTTNSGILNNNGTIYNCGGTIPETGGKVVQGCFVEIKNESTCENLLLNFTWVAPNTCKVTDDYTIESGSGIIIDNNIELVVADRIFLQNLGNLTLNSGTIINSHGIYNGGNLTLNSGTILINKGHINNVDKLFNSGTIISNCTGLQGNIINFSSGTITNSGTIENHNLFYNWGALNNLLNGILNNYTGECLPREAEIYNTKTIDNYGIINSNGTIDNNMYSKYAPTSGVSITNYSGGTINNYVNGTFENFNYSILYNSGTFNNAGTFYKCPQSHLSGTISGNPIDYLSDSTCYAGVPFSDDPLAFNMRPDHQMKAGISADDVQCKPGLEKLKRTSDADPICVSSSGAEKLIDLELAKKY